MTNQKKTAEASVLAVALQDFIKAGCLTDEGWYANLDAVDDARTTLANLSPATQAAMAVLQAAQYWQIGSHDTDRIRRLREAVTEYERVMGGRE